MEAILIYTDNCIRGLSRRKEKIHLIPPQLILFPVKHLPVKPKTRIYIIAGLGGKTNQFISELELREASFQRLLLQYILSVTVEKWTDGCTCQIIRLCKQTLCRFQWATPISIRLLCFPWGKSKDTDRIAFSSSIETIDFGKVDLHICEAPVYIYRQQGWILDSKQCSSQYVHGINTAVILCKLNQSRPME